VEYTLFLAKLSYLCPGPIPSAWWTVRAPWK